MYVASVLVLALFVAFNQIQFNQAAAANVVTIQLDPALQFLNSAGQLMETMGQVRLTPQSITTTG